MKVHFHKRFANDFRRLNPKIQHAFEDRLGLFCTNPYQIKLNNHPLKGKWEGYRSINVSGDYRAVYKDICQGEVIFTNIGSHGQLYS